MKKQLVFYKGGLLKFVGHLDLMRTLQRALRRADVPLAYSQGFNPHPLMSFASPLALGCVGEKEVMELKLEREMNDEELIRALNQELPQGLKILSCHTIEEQGPSAMAKVQAALYRIQFQASEDWPAIIEEWIRQERILVTKMGKLHGRKQQVEVDIKPWIYDWQMEDSKTLLLLCACGSEKNLKPELLVQELYRHIQKERYQYTEQITRLELFEKSKFGFHSLSNPGEV